MALETCVIMLRLSVGSDFCRVSRLWSDWLQHLPFLMQNSIPVHLPVASHVSQVSDSMVVGDAGGIGVGPALILASSCSFLSVMCLTA